MSMSTRLRVQRAVVLAAGLGVRMRPLSLERPKPLMPLWGTPVLEHVLRLLRDWGVTEVLVNMHHLPEQILAHVRNRRPDGLRISLSFEPKLLGTGGALRKADWFLEDDPFWLINADIAADLCPTPFLDAYADGAPISVLWMHSERGPRTVEMRNGLIRTFTSRAPGRPGTHTFCGLHLIDPRIRRYFPNRAAFSIIDAYRAAMQDGLCVRGITVPDSYWMDMGTPENYVRAHAEIRAAHQSKAPGARLYTPTRFTRRTGIQTTGFVSAGKNIRATGAVDLENAVLWDHVTLRRGARVSGTVVGSDVTVRGVIRHPLVRCRATGIPHIQSIVNELGWDIARTTAESLPARGSGRRFLRLQHPRGSAILVLNQSARHENRRYATHARFLAGIGFPVPTVLSRNTPANAILLQDLGQQSLDALVGSLSEQRLKAIYGAVLDSIALLHHSGTRQARRQRLALEPSFSERIFRYERTLFVNQFLQGYAGLPVSVTRAIRKELAELARRLLRAPPVLLHRDLQSSNIFLVKRHPIMIDFQGMRFGPAAYDLAALLYDPYADLQENMQMQLLNAYVARAKPAWHVRELFWPAAVQRLSQALGAYARFSASPDTRRFETFIPPALRLLTRALTHVDGLPRTTALIHSLGSLLAAGC